MTTRLCCAECGRSVSDHTTTLCYVCRAGPLCGRCVGNDVEHQGDVYPMCGACTQRCYWCVDCELVASFPHQGGAEPPRCQDCGLDVCYRCLRAHRRRQCAELVVENY